MPAKLPDAYINTTQVAKALGVSVSTVKRWVDEGILPAHKTAGGHRKLLLADVLDLTKRTHLPQADLSFLTGSHRQSRRKAVDASDYFEPLFMALRSGDLTKVRMLVRGGYRNGLTISQLADDGIGPAMERIGREWERGRLDVMEEHRASEICASAVYELKAQLETRAPRDRPLAVGGAASGDTSILPALLAQIALIDAGWNATNLGPDTPFDSYAKAIMELRPRLLWLSVCHLKDESVFVSEYTKLYRRAENLGVAVAIGGRALTESIRSQIPYTAFGDRLSHLEAFARNLHPRPRLPRRGRPSGRLTP